MLRSFVILVAIAAWLVVAFLAGHVSEDPSVFGRYSTPYFGALLFVAITAGLLSVVAISARAFQLIHGRRREIALLTATTLFLTVAIETAVRVLDIMGVSYYEALYRYDRDKISDPHLIYRHRPNHRAIYAGVRVETNELGLRDGPLGPKPEGEFRILALGDSVTFGWGVRIEDTFVKVLERNLWESLDRKIRVVNAGVGSYNTEQEEDFLRVFGEQVMPDAVLLTVVSNDVIVHEPYVQQAESDSSHASPPKRIQQILARAWTVRLITHLAKYGTEARRVPLQRNSPGWRRAMTALDGIIDYCESHNLPLAIVMYEHVAEAVGPVFAEDVRSLAEARGVPFTSTQQWWRGYAPRGLVRSAIDSHLNEAGNRLMAARVAEFLRQNGNFGLSSAMQSGPRTDHGDMRQQ